ncbi:MAG: hypothetical protein K2X81_02615 [Candidatus Obscuribacterales bacterium]|nr:hypothetical protein [Candidatus Obscuribacterales bacterium]
MLKTVCKLAIVMSQMAILCLPCSADELQDMLSSLASSDFKDAVSAGESYVKRHPNSAEGRYYLAKSYLGVKQGAMAEEQLRACMELAPVGSEMQNNCIAALREISQGRVGGATNAAPQQSGQSATSSTMQNFSPSSYSSSSQGKPNLRSESAGRSTAASASTSNVKTYAVLKKNTASQTQSSPKTSPLSTQPAKK